MKLVFFQRKPRPNKNFSLEILFDQIRENLPKDIAWKIEIAKYYSNGFFKRVYIALAAIFKQEEINHVTGDIGFVAIFLKKRKTVLTILDTGILDQSSPIARKIIQFFWIQLPVKRAAYVTTISNASKKELLKYVTVDEKKVRVIYVPVSKGMEFSPKTFNTVTPIILQIGTKENKNLIRLAQALKGIHCKLEIVGVLSQEQVLALAENKIDYNNVVNISNEELKVKYQQADLLAFVSTYEGFGMPIVEAQLIGRPVITSNLLSMPEVAGDGALLVNPYNIDEIRKGILKIIEDANYRQTLVKNGLENAQRFDVKIIANQYANLYKEVYQNNR